MSFVNTRDRMETVDFIDGLIEYLPETEQAESLALVEASTDVDAVSQVRLAEAAKQYAIVSWSAERAVKRYVESQGAEEEWNRLLTAVRPATALLLNRLRTHTKTHSLDQALATPEALSAIHGETEMEIELVRSEIRIDLWLAQPKGIKEELEEAKKEFEGMYQRLEKLRKFAGESDKRKSMEKMLEDFEQRIFFGRETIPLEVLDKELRFTLEDVLAKT